MAAGPFVLVLALALSLAGRSWYHRRSSPVLGGNRVRSVVGIMLWVGAAVLAAALYIPGYLLVRAFGGSRMASLLCAPTVMAALAMASRAAFAWAPGFKPIYGIIMISGVALGPSAGFFVGAISALASNFLFGRGPWTPWQMLGYGLDGLVFGLLAIYAAGVPANALQGVATAATLFLLANPLLAKLDRLCTKYGVGE